ncbi:7586_t:CDS:2 [Scutellospora calospora]|uniref:7586_t:CDS:1 n=1 Tax=Scutellospora calospora TaxID=85575 RepID=A0ACA9LDY5_9GLOM|nr:7586_t:CDS:2 [Scutellospora calospora]
MDLYLCYLCPPDFCYPYRSQSSLINHEKVKHPNNIIIPHIYTITVPSNYDIEQFKNVFIIQINKRLQFGHNAVKNKTIYFKGNKGYKELENLLKDNRWGSKEDGSGTTAYVLIENESEIYEVNFIWKEHLYKKYYYPLLCGSVICSFKTDVQDFILE